MLSASAEVRAGSSSGRASASERRSRPDSPVLPTPEPISFGSDLEKVLLAHGQSAPLPASSRGFTAVDEASAESSASAGRAVSGESLAEFAIDRTEAKLDPPRNVDQEVYEELVEAARQIFDAAGTASVPDATPIIEAVRASHEMLRSGDSLLTQIVRNRRDSRAWPERSANVAVLSMRLGSEMGLDEKRCLALGLCGLSHDVGMLTVPKAILESSRLDAEQLEVLRRHPHESSKILNSFGESFAWIGKIALQVHERVDGKGYPRGLRGEEIHEIAQILGLADTYEAMAHPRPDRKAQATYNALARIIDFKNTQFDRTLTKALIRVISIFPLGSLVKLNNGEIGRVIGTKVAHPTRPTIEILVDSRGERENPQSDNGRLLDLREEPLLNIVDPAIDESQVQSQ